MHHQSTKSKQYNFWFIFKLLLASVILISFSPRSVWAQEPTPELEPQKVIAIWEDQCADQPWLKTLEVWNVGAAGGEVYAQAIFSGQTCYNGKLVDSSGPLYGTFTGGPNGVATFQICPYVDDPNNCVTLNFQFVEGNLEGFVVQNPEAFGVDVSNTGPDCTADIHYDPALKPGDVLSPWSTYTAVPGGQDVIPIGEAYSINGTQTPSVVWDGQETIIELQYTCPGHQGHITTVTVPAAGNPTFTPTAIVTITPVGTGTSTPEITDTPNPTDTSTPEAPATFTLTPTKTSCKHLSADAKLTEILNRYYTQIPRGITDSGNKNNLLTLWDDKYNDYVCGNYQGKVLQLLSDIKFNSDPCVSTLLDDWDYGPIEALWGGHQAVVIYPRGTTWTDTGLVLDPWITQSPQVYTIQDWSLQFSASSQYGVRGSSDYENQAQYPTVGGNYTPSGDLKLTAEENNFIRTLALDKQEWLKKMSPVNRKAWVMQMMRRQMQNATLTVNSPLDLYLTDDAGRFAGFMNGDFVDDLPDVSFRRFLRADGHYWTEVEYPADRNYRVVMYGTGDGQARVFNTIAEDGTADVVYQYDFSVSASEFYQSEIGEIGASFVSSQTRIEPDVIMTADSEWIESQPGLVEPERFTQDVQPPSNLIILIVCSIGACLITFLIFMVGIIRFTRKRSKA
jgi:hypothetical protein